MEEYEMNSDPSDEHEHDSGNALRLNKTRLFVSQRCWTESFLFLNVQISLLIFCQSMTNPPETWSDLPKVSKSQASFQFWVHYPFKHTSMWLLTRDVFQMLFSRWWTTLLPMCWVQLPRAQQEQVWSAARTPHVITSGVFISRLCFCVSGNSSAEGLNMTEVVFPAGSIHSAAYTGYVTLEITRALHVLTSHQNRFVSLKCHLPHICSSQFHVVVRTQHS